MIRPTDYKSKSDTDSEGQASSRREISINIGSGPLSASINQRAGNTIQGPVDENGKRKDARLLIEIKLDLEAEIHLTARI